MSTIIIIIYRICASYEVGHVDLYCKWKEDKKKMRNNTITLVHMSLSIRYSLCLRERKGKKREEKTRGMKWNSKFMLNSSCARFVFGGYVVGLMCVFIFLFFFFAFVPKKKSFSRSLFKRDRWRKKKKNIKQIVGFNYISIWHMHFLALLIS